jgi:hypothetical protein
MCCRKEVLKTVPTSRGETGKVNDFEKTTPPSPAVIQRVDKALEVMVGHEKESTTLALGARRQVRHLK